MAGLRRQNKECEMPVDQDVRNGVTPLNGFKPPAAPTIANLRAALTAFSAASYPSHRLDTMTKLDLIYACRVHGLSVVGL